MKALLALVIIYVGTFLIAIQGASQNQVQAARQNSAAQDQAAGQPQTTSIDPAKEADIRSLMELLGARDQIQDAINNSTEQYKEKLLTTVPDNEKGQAFVASFAEGYQKSFSVDQVTDQLVGVYDKHFTDDEIKSLLQFYGSPLGQKVAAEMPKVTREIQAATRTAGAKAAKETLQALKAQSPEIGQTARLFGNGANGNNGARRWQQRKRGPQDQAPQVAQQPDPQQP
jgi:uncharacterized protein